MESTLQVEFEEIKKLKSKYFIDIGASCSSEASQSEKLLEHGWSGLMFECDPSKYPIQIEKMKNESVSVLTTKVNPDNILQILEENNVPDGFYLSLDIDGYDFFVLEKILTKYKPELIISEINEKIPPPIKFTVNYDNDYFWDCSHYFGYSISMLEDLLDKYNYKIKRLDWNNVVLVPGNQEESISDIYNEGYLNRPGRNNIFYYNSDFEVVYNMSKEDQIKFIDSKFSPFVNERQLYSGRQLDGKEITYRNYTLR
jgi:hypothetical protein